MVGERESEAVYGARKAQQQAVVDENIPQASHHRRRMTTTDACRNRTIYIGFYSVVENIVRTLFSEYLQHLHEIAYILNRIERRAPHLNRYITYSVGNSCAHLLVIFLWRNKHHLMSFAHEMAYHFAAEVHKSP